MAKASTQGSQTSRAKKSPAKSAGKKNAVTAETSNRDATPQSASPQDREHMIQYAAYHIAERDGFQPGKEKDYWLQAERQIDDLLRGREQAQADVH